MKNGDVNKPDISAKACVKKVTIKYISLKIKLRQEKLQKCRHGQNYNKAQKSETKKQINK